MKTIYQITMLLVLIGFSATYVEGEFSRAQKEGSQIPTTLAEAHIELERLLSSEELARIDAMMAEDEMITYHFGLGMYLRNNWGLWRDSQLSKHMKQLGFTHPDDMSSVILKTFWCKRHDQNFRLEERVEDYRAYWEGVRKSENEENLRVKKAQASMKNMMIGLQIQNSVPPVIRMPERTGSSLRARYLFPYHKGVLLAVRKLIGSGDNEFVTQGYYFDPTTRKIRRVLVEGIQEVHSVVVAEQVAWFAGYTNKQPVLMGINDQKRNILPLPQNDILPQLGLDGQSLLAVYPHSVYRLKDHEWEQIYSGETNLPRSGPPPQLYGGKLFFRDEGHWENGKRLWWLPLSGTKQLTSLDQDVGVVGPNGPRWENSFSYSVSRHGDMWATVGEGSNRKSLLRKDKDGNYSIAILNNSIQFTPDLFGSKESDQGLSVSAVTLLQDDSVLLVGDRGLYRIKDHLLVQDLSFTNTHQKIPVNNGKNVYHWSWDPSKILILEKDSYLISGAFGGVYMLNKNTDGQFQFESLDEKLGDNVVW